MSRVASVTALMATGRPGDSEAIHAGGREPQDLLAGAGVDAVETRARRRAPGPITAGQVHHRPVAAPQEPVGAEARQEVIDVGAQVVGLPAGPGLGGEARELARHAR